MGSNIRSRNTSEKEGDMEGGGYKPIILLKNKGIWREGGITGFSDYNIMVGCIMEINALIEIFEFSM